MKYLTWHRRIAPLALIPILFGTGGLLAAAKEAELLDFWEQASRTAVVGEGTGVIPIEKRQMIDYENHEVRLRFDKVKVGSFSIELEKPGPVTLLTSIWGKFLPVPKEATLEFWLGSGGAPQALPAEMDVTLLGSDGGNKSVKAMPVDEESGWTRYRVALPADAPESLKAISLAPGGEGLLLDGVLLRAGDKIVGLTDKPLEQWMREAAETRSERVRVAFENGTKTDVSGELRQWFDKLYLGQEVKECNAKMQNFFKNELQSLQQEKADIWDLQLNVRLIESYYELGSKSGRNPAPLEPETEKLLLEVLWGHTKDVNDIGWASSNTWWLTGSENHDLNAKICSLVSSRIFMDEPEYRDRLYPDAARGPGHAYWFHVMFGTGGTGYGPDSVAPWKFTGQYRAADHYKAWLAFFDRYVTERAKRGFFLENASCIYMKWTLGFLHTLRAYCGNEALKGKLGDFFNLVWADWAQEQIAGIRGGPKTRHHYSVGGKDSMTDMSSFFLGGPGTTLHIYTAMLLDDYKFAPVVFDLALDSCGRGTYAIAARGIGEEEGVRPRPEGMERTFLLDRNARFLKYAWVTPSYILGTQMDHPDALHSHLSALGRWHGLIVAGDPETRIVPTGGIAPTEDGRMRPDLELMFLTAQDKNVLVGQQARRWIQISPGWFPSTPMYEKPIVLHVGTGWDEIKEQDGWLFFRKGNAYAAAREVLPQKSETRSGEVNYQDDLSVEGSPNLVRILNKSPQWTKEKDGIVFQDKFSPFIIHAGSKSEHGDFAAFREAVLKSRLELRKTVVPGYYLLAYQGSEPGSMEIVFPAAAPEIPTIGGKPVDYQPPELFAGPYLQSKFGSGKVKIAKGNYILDLDFNSKVSAKSGQK